MWKNSQNLLRVNLSQLLSFAVAARDSIKLKATEWVEVLLTLSLYSSREEAQLELHFCWILSAKAGRRRCIF